MKCNQASQAAAAYQWPFACLVITHYLMLNANCAFELAKTEFPHSVKQYSKT
jgi:hypothetical protein